MLEFLLFQVVNKYCVSKVSRYKSRIQISSEVRYKKSVWGLVKSMYMHVSTFSNFLPYYNLLMSISIFVIKLLDLWTATYFSKLFLNSETKVKLDYDSFDRIPKNFRITNEEFNQMNASFFNLIFFYSVQTINYCNEVHVVALQMLKTSTTHVLHLQCIDTQYVLDNN